MDLIAWLFLWTFLAFMAGCFWHLVRLELRERKSLRKEALINSKDMKGLTKCLYQVK